MFVEQKTIFTSGWIASKKECFLVEKKGFRQFKNYLERFPKFLAAKESFISKLTDPPDVARGL